MYLKGEPTNSEWVDSGIKFVSMGWLTGKKNGMQTLPFKWGVQKGFLNPNNPEVINFLKTLVSELTQYSVDGILIDDHFSMKPGFGYDKDTNEIAAKFNSNGMFPSRKKLMTKSSTDGEILRGSTTRANGKRFILYQRNLNFSKGSGCRIGTKWLDLVLLMNFYYKFTDTI